MRLLAGERRPSSPCGRRGPCEACAGERRPQGPEAATGAEALRTAARGLLAQRPQLGGPQGEECAKALALVGTVLMESAPEKFAGEFTEVRGGFGA